MARDLGFDGEFVSSFSLPEAKKCLFAKTTKIVAWLWSGVANYHLPLLIGIDWAVVALLLELSVRSSPKSPAKRLGRDSKQAACP